MKHSGKLVILLILLLGLLVFSWFQKDLIYSYGDSVFSFFPLENLQNYYTTWFSNASTGIPNIQAIPQLPYKGFFALAQLIGLPLYLAQRFLFYLLFVSGGLSMYFLVITIFPESKIKNLTALIASVFYMLNSYSLVSIWGIVVQSLFIYPFLPLLLAIFIRGLNANNRGKFKYILGFCLVSFLASPAFSNASFVILIWLLVIPFFIYFLIVNFRDKVKISYAFKFFLLLIIFWTVLNLYWLIPYVYSVRSLAYEATTSGAFAGGSVKALTNASITAYLLNSFRLFGYNYFDLRPKFMDKDPFYSYASTYDSKIFIFLSFLIPLIAFSGLIFMRKEKSEERFYLFYFLFFTFLTLFFYKGTQPPLGEFFAWLMGKFSFVAAFRHPVSKIGPLLPIGLGVLFGYAFSNYYRKLSQKYSGKISAIVISLLFIAIFVVYQYPFWTGKVFHPKGEIARSALVKVPDYYKEAGEWLRSQKEIFRLAAVPATGLWGIAFDWEYGYDGSNPVPFLLNRSILTAEEGNTPGAFLWQSISSGSDNNDLELKLKGVKNLMGLLNAKYLLFHNDVVLDYFNIPKNAIKRAATNLDKGIDGLSKERTFGQLEFYKLDDRYFLPLIFTPRVITHSSQGLASLAPLVSDSDFQTNNAVFFAVNLSSNTDIFAQMKGYNDYYEKRLKDNDNNEIVTHVIEIQTIPELKFKKINQTKYQIKVNKAEQDFLLVLNESFDKDWKAYFKMSKNGDLSSLENDNIFETASLVQVEEKNHLKANGYANSWWIERPCKKLKGQPLVKFVKGFECSNEDKAEDFEIILEFFPQTLFYKGTLLSLGGWFLLAAVFLVERRDKIFKITKK